MNHYKKNNRLLAEPQNLYLIIIILYNILKINFY